jgi:ABC-type sugar transport system permease subunit
MRAALPAKALPYLLILPALVTLLCLFIYPILWNAYISLHEVDFQTYNRDWPGRAPRIIGRC